MLQPLNGRDRVPTLFDVLLSRVEIHVFAPRQLFAGACTVVDLVDVECETGNAG